MGQVTVWKMTEEERLAYIEKHPITPKKKRPNKGITFATDNPNLTPIDWNWRWKNGVESRWKDK
jgi:hypothetical protein